MWSVPWLRTITMVSAVLAARPGSARADFIAIPTPYTGNYLTSTTKITLPPAGTTYNSLSDGIETITATTSPTPVAMSTIGGAGSSFGWGNPPTVEQSNPLVMLTGPNGNTAMRTVTLTFSVPVTTFGVEMMPNYWPYFFPDTTTAKFYDGSTLVGTISKGLESPGGARLFAGHTDTEPFTSVTLTHQVLGFGTQGLLVGQIRYASVPEPSTLRLAGIAGLVSAAGYGWCRRRRAGRLGPRPLAAGP